MNADVLAPHLDMPGQYHQLKQEGLIVRITSIKINNYKSILASGEVKFNNGFNIIVGKNNSGKTSMIEAIAGEYTNQPSKILSASLVSSPPGSVFEINFEISIDELERLLESKKVLRISLPGNNMPMRTYRLDEFFKFEDVSDGRVYFRTIVSPDGTSTECVNLSFTPVESLIIGFTRENKNKWKCAGNAGNGGFTDIRQFIWDQLKAITYRFSDFRRALAQHSLDSRPDLAKDASNLASVINLVRSNKKKWKTYCDWINWIFPDIKDINIHVTPNNTMEVVVWKLDPQSGRTDLALPLESCGAGVAQVLAMAYVLLTDFTSIIFLIDEPQTFLHPGALRRLLDLFLKNSQHQYFLATHASEVVSRLRPAKIILLSNPDGGTNFQQLENEQICDVEKVLVCIEARLSDLFGADSVLWVEGPTEAAVFPKLLAKAGFKLGGVQIQALFHTGDIETKNKKMIRLVLDIYRRLCGGNTLLPPALGIILDKERRNDKEQEDLRRIAGSGDRPIQLKFLSRMMYENYLLDFESISRLLKEEIESVDSIDMSVPTEADTLNWFLKKQLAETGNGAVIDLEWQKSVHAANLLTEYFQTFNIPYQKTIHSVRLTELILGKNAGLLQELTDLLSSYIVS